MLQVTNQSSEEVVSYFSQLAEPDFARTGGVASDTVVLGEGPLPDFGHSMEPQVGRTSGLGWTCDNWSLGRRAGCCS